MVTFLAIMIAGFLLLVGGALFGHDHEFGHDLGGHDSLGHDSVGHDHTAGHDQNHENQGVVSIFSMKVIGTFIMGFGGGGALARYENLSWIPASLTGLGVGVVMGACIYGVLRLMYGHQANSLIYANELLNKTGIVTIPIGEGAIGEVDVSLGEQNVTHMARGTQGKAISKGKTVKVVASEGSQLLVEEVN